MRLKELAKVMDTEMVTLYNGATNEYILEKVWSYRIPDEYLDWVVYGISTTFISEIEIDIRKEG